MTDWIEFDIHGRATMRVARSAPTASLLQDMFAPFVTVGVGAADLTVTGEWERLEGAAFGEDDYTYTENGVQINPMRVQILRDPDGGIRLIGAGELLVHALPLIDRIAVTRDAAMIHAATVEYDGRGICLPAWGGTGKTSTIAKLLRRDRVAFMGDDWAFLSGDGELLGYAKPMFIKPHHRAIYPHLFQTRRKPLVPTRLSRPVGHLTTLVHPVITRYPNLARITRHWSPEHMMVSPQVAFPQAQFSTRAPLGAVIFVERYDGLSTVLCERGEDWMVSRLVGNFHAEMTRISREVLTALGATGLVPIERHFQEKADVVARAVAGKPSYLLQVPRAFTPDEASDVIVDYLERVLTEVAVA